MRSCRSSTGSTSVTSQVNDRQTQTARPHRRGQHGGGDPGQPRQPAGDAGRQPRTWSCAAWPTSACSWPTCSSRRRRPPRRRPTWWAPTGPSSTPSSTSCTRTSSSSVATRSTWPSPSPTSALPSRASRRSGTPGPTTTPTAGPTCSPRVWAPPVSDPVLGSCGVVDQALDLALGADPLPCSARDGAAAGTGDVAGLRRGTHPAVDRGPDPPVARDAAGPRPAEGLVSGRIVAGLAVVVMATGLAACSGGGGGYHVSADFTQGIGLYPGSPVRVLGINIGRITDITNRGNLVRVDMHIDKTTTKLPADVTAAIVPVSLLGERYIQFGPVYTGGAPLTPGAHLPVDAHPGARGDRRAAPRPQGLLRRHQARERATTWWPTWPPSSTAKAPSSTSSSPTRRGRCTSSPTRATISASSWTRSPSSRRRCGRTPTRSCSSSATTTRCRGCWRRTRAPSTTR